ncbi:hypothetical protein ABFX02_07G069800 [Erythranthe guttata]
MDPHQNEHYLSSALAPPDVAAEIEQEPFRVYSQCRRRCDAIGSPHILNVQQSSGPRCPSFGSSTTDSWPSGMRIRFKENELVTIKVRTPCGKIEGEIRKIPKEEAICKCCFDVYTDDMLETKCKCKFAMIHQPCAIEWLQKKGDNKCDVCEEDIQNISIVVSWDHMSSTRTTNNKEHNKISTSKRFWRNYCCFSL